MKFRMKYDSKKKNRRFRIGNSYFYPVQYSTKKLLIINYWNFNNTKYLNGMKITRAMIIY